MLTESSYNRGISSCSYSTSTPDHSLLHTDSSFEIITDDYSMIHNCLSPATSLRSSFLGPLQKIIVQNTELKKLLEECTKKVATVAKDREMVSQQLQMEKNKCATLEEETLRLQVEITSLHQVIALICTCMRVICMLAHIHRALPPYACIWGKIRS